MPGAGTRLDPQQITDLVHQTTLRADEVGYTAAAVPDGWTLADTRVEPPAVATTARFAAGVPDAVEPDLTVTLTVAAGAGDGAGWTSMADYITRSPIVAVATTDDGQTIQVHGSDTGGIAAVCALRDADPICPADVSGIRDLPAGPDTPAVAHLDAAAAPFDDDGTTVVIGASKERPTLPRSVAAEGPVGRRDRRVVPLPGRPDVGADVDRRRQPGGLPGQRPRPPLTRPGPHRSG